MHDKSKIISENKKRLLIFDKKYDPYTGEGSLLDREKVFFSDVGANLYLPKSMINENQFVYDLLESGNFQDYSKEKESDVSTILAAFDKIRFEHDFEYWGIQTIIIQHKETLKDFKFRLRLAQQVLLYELEKMRLAGVPIRIVLLKARQWGGSTLVQMYMFWIQQIHRVNWHLAVCAQDDGAARNISEMYRRASTSYPEAIAEIQYKPYAGSSKNIINIERGGIIGVGSINNPDQFRSFNYPMIHVSEPGVWEDTPKRTAGQLVASLRSTVSKEPMTLVILESTAKGVGSFFHNEWLLAEKEESAYKAVFIPWYKIDMYMKDIPDYGKMIDGMNQYDWFCWDKGATLEGIHWYNSHKIGENYSDYMMFNEFPTTAEEAFVASGERYFSPESLANVKESIMKPKLIATVHPVGAKSKSDIKLTSFTTAPKGPLKIWGLPKTIVTLRGIKYYVVNRYCAAGDIGGVTDKADFSVLTILDRYWMLYGGWPQLAAEWRGHLYQDQFAWVAAQISYSYDNALLAIETNSLKTEKSDGDHYLTILDNIKDHYDNLYIRNQFDRTDKDWMPKLGFHMNASSKDMIFSSLRKGLRDNEFVEKSMAAYEEYGYFERKKDGTLGAIDGQHDDICVTRALAYWMAISPVAMPPVKLVPYLSDEEKKDKRRKRNIIISEATM